MKYIFRNNSLFYLNFCSLNYLTQKIKKTVFGYPDFFNMNIILEMKKVKLFKLKKNFALNLLKTTWQSGVYTTKINQFYLNRI